MKPFTRNLDAETQLLVALGAAAASGCIPSCCFNGQLTRRRSANA